MFAPLRIISGYSFLKSGLTIEKIADSVAKEGFSGAAISDLNTLYGVPSFIEAMEKLNKGYLIGMEVNVDNNFLVLYCYSEEGYRNLLRITSLMVIFA